MKNETFLKDIQSFIEFIDTNKTMSLQAKYRMLVDTLLHDLNGVIENEPFFLPRVDGYSRLD